MKVSEVFQTTMLSMSPGAMDDLIYILIGLLITVILFILALIFVIRRLKSGLKEYSFTAYTTLFLLILSAGYVARTQTENEKPQVFIISSTLVFFSLFMILIIYLKDRNGK